MMKVEPRSHGWDNKAYIIYVYSVDAYPLILKEMEVMWMQKLTMYVLQSYL